MAILEVTLEQEYVGQQSINRFTYIQTGTPASVSPSFGLIAAMGAIASVGVYPVDKLMNIIALSQQVNVTFVQIAAKNLYSFTDFYQVPFVEPLVGDVEGEGLPPSNAHGYRTNRTRLDIRRGFKRFVGFPESGQAQGTLSGGQLALNDAVAEALGEVLTYNDEGNTLTYTPAILGRHAQADPEDETKKIYPYFATEALQLEHAMTSIIWEAYPTVRTQTTRQFGRGS